MKCFYHNETDAAGQCTNCGKFLCQNCMMQDYSTMKIYCPDCAKALDLYCVCPCANFSLHYSCNVL